MAAVFEKARREVTDSKAVLAVAPVRLTVSKWRFGGSLGSFGRPLSFVFFRVQHGYYVGQNRQ